MKIIFSLIIYLISVEITFMYRERYVAKPYDSLDQLMVYLPILNSIVFLTIIFTSTRYILTNTIEGFE